MREINLQEQIERAQNVAQQYLWGIIMIDRCVDVVDIQYLREKERRLLDAQDEDLHENAQNLHNLNIIYSLLPLLLGIFLYCCIQTINNPFTILLLSN
ncbi:MAG: hypothetical protein BAJALOKI3v1_90028 [Promethearchaeota archaeon]|nr:MAG: hypothetical protein BAJALOKI3v1_90028 [Candidatus Lokiarchaeota archaeon]